MPVPVTVPREEFVGYLFDLMLRALDRSGFTALCTLLRVSGLQDSGWDPLEESKQAFEDYSWHLRADRSRGDEGAKSTWRMALLMYCQAVEMSAPHEMLENLMRCLRGEPYHVAPFGHLSRKNKKEPFTWVPPSAKTKLRVLRESALRSGEQKLADYIDSFFSDSVRNAFSHSDYIITPDKFRWTEGGVPSQLELTELGRLLENAFGFYEGFLKSHTMALKALGAARRYHKWPQYEVVELLSAEEVGVHGFAVHFSNGCKAVYSRTPKGVECTNVMFQKDGSINFFVGPLDKLEPVWKVDGRPFTDSDERGLGSELREEDGQDPTGA